MMRRLVCMLGVLLALSVPARAHVGSNDVYQTVHAGPYQLFVTVRPPLVLPGVATVEVRAAGVRSVGVAPAVMGYKQDFALPLDTMVRSAADPDFYTGTVWLMVPGSWEVRLQVQGEHGTQTAAVAVPAQALGIQQMQRPLGTMLAVVGLLLLGCMVALVVAAARQAHQPPGADAATRLPRAALLSTVAIMLVAVVVAARWWAASATLHAATIFHPTPVTVRLAGNALDLVATPQADNLGRVRAIDDLLADHGQFIHLYAIRMPGMDAAFHLHPQMVGPGQFRMALPAMAAGHYALYGDVVHTTGLPETLVAGVDVPAGMPAAPLAALDAAAAPPPLSAGVLDDTYRLPTGYTMHWQRPAQINANRAYLLAFHLRAPDGTPATAMQPYLGMAGHAAFVKTDGSVFAHTHPDGTAAMPAMELAARSVGSEMEMPQTVTPDVTFPYGFPSAGRYRIFIQMQHAGTVETGVFDAEVQP